MGHAASTQDQTFGGTAEALVARQPILDRRRQLVAYELRFDGTGGSPFDQYFPSPEEEAERISESCAVLAHGQPTHVRLTRAALLESRHQCLPPGGTTLFVQPDDIDDLALEACGRLKAAGYQLGLTEPPHEPAPRLLDLADVVRFEVLGALDEDLAQCVETCRQHGAVPLASWVETGELFLLAAEHGFEQFEGFFLQRPEIIETSKVPGFKLNYIRFFQKVNQPELDFGELETIIKSEVSISLKLLRYLNTAAFNWRKEVTSIRQALILLGERPIRRWAALLAVAGLGEDRPRELTATCLVRARFCELLGPASGLDGREFDLFFAGMLSAVDALVGRPIDEVLQDMSVDEEIREALLGESSLLADVLELALAYEQGDWPRFATRAKDIRIDPGQAITSYREAATWAQSVLG